MKYKEQRKNNLVPSYPNRGISLVRGEGVYLYDENNKKYLDCLSNYGVSILGYGVAEIEEALEIQIKKIINVHGSFNNPTRLEAVKELNSVLPKNLSHIFFSNSGTESVEAAIKYSLLATGRKKIIALKNGYHGKTLGSLSATTSNNGKYKEPFEEFLLKSEYIEPNKVKELENTLSEDFAGLIIEPIQGEGGINIISSNYLEKARKLCTKYGILLIFDEIQTGMGRTGGMFAFESSNLTPDILCLGKGIAGGIPCGVTVLAEGLSKKITPGIHTNTYGGSPLACAGMLSTLRYIKKNRVLENVLKVSRYLFTELNNLKKNSIKEIRGRGLMVAIELNTKAMPFVVRLQKRGILVGLSGENTIRLLPPLIVRKEDIKFLLNELEYCLD